MYEQIEQPKENKRWIVVNAPAQKKSDSKPDFGFVDNRPKSMVQRLHQSVIYDAGCGGFSTAGNSLNFETPEDQNKVIQRAIQYDIGDGDCREKLFENIKKEKGIDYAEQIIKYYEDHQALFSSRAVYDFAMNPENAPHNKSDSAEMKESVERSKKEAHAVASDKSTNHSKDTAPTATHNESFFDVNCRIDEIRQNEPANVLREFLRLKRKNGTTSKEGIEAILKQARENPRDRPVSCETVTPEISENRSVKVPTKKQQQEANSNFFPDGLKEPHIHYHQNGATFTDTRHSHKDLQSKANIQAVIDDLNVAILSGGVDVERYQAIIERLISMMTKLC